MRTRRATGRSTRLAAFTLIEILVVVTIIGILATLVVPRVIGVIWGSRQKVALGSIAGLEGAIKRFQVDCGRFPTNQEGVRALWHPPSDVADDWHGPYVDKEKDILDPWDREFLYQHPGRHNVDFDLWTFGADGQEGGEDANADITSWD